MVNANHELGVCLCTIRVDHLLSYPGVITARIVYCPLHEAAPNLLEVCKRVANECPQCAGTRETQYADQEKGVVTNECRICVPALKAIAKAEGKS